MIWHSQDGCFPDKFSCLWGQKANASQWIYPDHQWKREHRAKLHLTKVVFFACLQVVQSFAHKRGTRGWHSKDRGWWAFLPHFWAQHLVAMRVGNALLLLYVQIVPILLISLSEQTASFTRDLNEKLIVPTESYPMGSPMKCWVLPDPQCFISFSAISFAFFVPNTLQHSSA